MIQAIDVQQVRRKACVHTIVPRPGAFGLHATLRGIEVGISMKVVAARGWADICHTSVAA